MKIVTGYTGAAHVTSNAVQGFNQGIFGSGNYVLNVGSKFNAVLTDTNTVTVSDGEGVMQGVHFRIDPGTVETVNISNGTTGYNRIDLICARYTKNASTGIEDVSLVVVEGTPNASTPSEPSYNTGTILTGGTPVDYPLCKVTLTGLSPAIEALFDIASLTGVGPVDVANMSSESLTVGSDVSKTSAGAYYSVAVEVVQSNEATASIMSSNSDVWDSAIVPVASNTALGTRIATTGWVYIPSGVSFIVHAESSGNAYFRTAPAL